MSLAERFGDAGGPSGPGSDPEHPGLVRIYKDLDSRPPTITRTPGTATRPGARSRRWARSCAASNARRSAATRSGPTWSRAYEDLPDHIKEQIDGLYARHSIEATFGARMPIEKRLALKAQFPDAEHPVVRTHPETGEKVLFVNGFTTHFTNFHTPRTSATARTTPGASELLNYLIRRAASPSTRCAGAGRRTASRSGTTAAPSITPSWITGPRSGRWSAPESSATSPSDPTPHPPRGEEPCSSSTTPASRKPGEAGHHRRALRPRVGAARLPGRPRRDDGRARPEGGRLLQCRRHRAAHPRARARTARARSGSRSSTSCSAGCATPCRT